MLGCWPVSGRDLLNRKIEFDGVELTNVHCSTGALKETVRLAAACFKRQVVTWRPRMWLLWQNWHSICGICTKLQSFISFAGYGWIVLPSHRSARNFSFVLTVGWARIRNHAFSVIHDTLRISWLYFNDSIFYFHYFITRNMWQGCYAHCHAFTFLGCSYWAWQH